MSCSCAIEGCLEHTTARGLCNKHYLELYNKGEFGPKRVDRPIELVEKQLRKVNYMLSAVRYFSQKLEETTDMTEKHELLIKLGTALMTLEGFI